jgi:NAD(P)-dependent dehydrogenase (short-subunit alcohol dehydrogenase family)
MNQRVLVTAGASGIGREIVRAFAQNGDKVYVCDIDATALDELAQELSGVVTKVCDIGSPQDIAQMVAFGAEALGGFDVLVNNAGIAGPTAPVEEFDPAAWEQVVQINLNGTFHVTRLVIPYLRRSAAGVIINMSSVAGRFGYENRSAYATTKWGIVGFTKTLSIELGQYGIRANAILPGAVAGPRIEKVLEGRAQASGKSLEEIKQEAMASQSIKRLVDPKDIAALALFLASDSGKSISGQILPIDNDMQKAS